MEGSQARGWIVEIELQLAASATTTAMWDLSHICYLHHSFQQHQILNPLSEARGWICILMGASLVNKPMSHNRNSLEHQFLMLAAHWN